MNSRPNITATDRKLRKVTRDALAALEKANQPPCIFVRDSRLVRVRLDENGVARVETLSQDALRGRLTEVADFADGTYPRAVAPPTVVVADILSRGRWKGFPSQHVRGGEGGG